VDADLRRAGEDQGLMRQSDRCGQRTVRRGTPRGWILTLHMSTYTLHMSFKHQSQHVSSGGVRVRENPVSARFLRGRACQGRVRTTRPVFALQGTSGSTTKKEQRRRRPSSQASPFQVRAESCNTSGVYIYLRCIYFPYIFLHTVYGGVLFPSLLMYRF